MAKRFTPGQHLYNWKIIQYLPTDHKNPSPTLRVRLRVECVCGNRLTLPQYYLYRKTPEPKKHCGCLDAPPQDPKVKLTYNSWYMMRYRCREESHVAYKHYGGRGISVCPEWNDPDTGFAAFLKDMGMRPSEDYSIDRYPDNNGNYTKNNCRWATAQMQRDNQRPRVSGTG